MSFVFFNSEPVTYAVSPSWKNQNMYQPSTSGQIIIATSHEFSPQKVAEKGKSHYFRLVIGRDSGKVGEILWFG